MLMNWNLSMLKFNGLEFEWTGHDGFRIVDTTNNKTIYIDPFQLTKLQKSRRDADIILISHNHYDHLSLEDLRPLLKRETSIVSARECITQLRDLQVEFLDAIEPGKKINVKEIIIEAVPAY